MTRKKTRKKKRKKPLKLKKSTIRRMKTAIHSDSEWNENRDNGVSRCPCFSYSELLLQQSCFPFLFFETGEDKPVTDEQGTLDQHSIRGEERQLLIF